MLPILYAFAIDICNTSLHQFIPLGPSTKLARQLQCCA